MTDEPRTADELRDALLERIESLNSRPFRLVDRGDLDAIIAAARAEAKDRRGPRQETA